MTAPQSDSLVGPITEKLIAVAQQIEGVGACYAKVPDAAPDDNSVMFACKHVEITSTTNGRLTLHLTFDLIHAFRRTRLQDALARCYAALPAWLTVLGSYKNASLGGTVELLDLKAQDIREVKHGGQQMLAVVSTVVVRANFRIPT